MNGTGRSPENYRVEDFIADESFTNYFFHLDPQDARRWETWIAAHPDKASEIEAAKQVLGDLSLTISDMELDEELKKLKRSIESEDSRNLMESPEIARLRQSRRAPKWEEIRKAKLAVILSPLLLFIGLVCFLIIGRPVSHHNQLVQKVNDGSGPVVIVLSDSTIVTLEPHSIFRYPSDFGNKNRRVFLKGAAQFHVSKDAARPFKVYDGELIATVLGTIFNIKEQAGDSVLLIELLEGKLRVETANGSSMPPQSIVLNPDERAMYNSRNKSLSKEIWKAQADPSVTIPKMEFRQDNFEEIAKQIKIDFGLTLINTSNKKNWRFTGVFTNVTARELIENVCLAEGLSSQMNGDTILIKSLP